MYVKINKLFAHLVDEETTDRQKLWLAFWSQIYLWEPPTTWLNLHSIDFALMMGDPRKATHMNSDPNNYYAKKYLGEKIAADFEWMYESKENVYWRSKSLNNFHPNGNAAYKPTHEVEITDPHVINLYWYLMGRTTFQPVGPRSWRPAKYEGTLDKDALFFLTHVIAE